MKRDILEELCELRRKDAAARALCVPVGRLYERARRLPPVPDFAAAFAGEGIHVIAELKKASPSEGLIRADFDPVGLAGDLEAAGAAALSVLCEPHRFQGDEAYLKAAEAAVEIPILYKDFVTTPYQVAAARCTGASAVLLIAAVLGDAQLIRLLVLARCLGMRALVETHDKEEIDRAVAARAQIIGVNCRDLRTFKTDPKLTAQLLGRIPSDCVRIAESGIRTREDIRALRDAGANGFLIGTTLMRARFPGEKLKGLLK